MKPYISVIIPTTRIGGLDILFSGLETQVFKDFELILVDTLYNQRKYLVAEKASQYSFPVKHLLQRETAIHYCETMNSALVNAEGYLMYTMCDHTWLEKNCLQMHVDFHKNKKPGEKYVLIGHFADYKLPKLHKDFYRTYAPNIPYYREDPHNQYMTKERECYNNYIDDIYSGKLDNMMWSIYETPFTTSTDPNSFEITLPKKILPTGEVDSSYFNLKNESYVLDDVIAINGFNEALDGAHGWQDWEFADRLIALTGAKLYNNSNIKTFTMNPRQILYARLRNTDMFLNEKVWQDGKKTNFKNRVNTWSLKEARETKNNTKQDVVKSVHTTKKPYLSVICATMRPGGFDVLFNSLEHQTFKDFELIISDSLYEYRKDIIKEMAKKYSFQYKHIAPITDRFPIFSFCHGFNSALVQASGDVVLLTTDYRYFTPRSLQKHADFHRSHADNIGYAPGTKAVLPPLMKSGIPFYGRNENYNQYIEDLKNGKLQDYMWSIFDNDIFSQPQDLSTWQEIDRVKIGYDPKTNAEPGTEVSPLHIYLQGESIKTKIALEANGLNEDFDGAPSHQDIEFAHRLRNLFNFRWVGDNTNITYRMTGGEKVIGKAKLLEEVQNKAQIIFKKYEDGSTEPVNTWSLTKVHTENQNKTNKNTREMMVDFFGRTFKALDWHFIPGNNGSDNPWLDEATIRQKYWTSLTPGSVVIDIGACFGLYTLPALMQGCRVVAFEPNVEYSNQIAESVAMNGFTDRYQCHNVCIWNNTEMPDELAKPILQWCKKEPPLLTTTLDEITRYLDRVDIIKIDVEGAEAGVMECAHETIKRHKPSFLIEDHTGLYPYPDAHNTRGKIIDILLQYGYTIQTELFGGPPPPGGGRWFIYAAPPPDLKTNSANITDQIKISMNGQLNHPMQLLRTEKPMKIAFLFGSWSIGTRPLDFNCLWSSPRGLTGSELGIVITAKEMAKLGHDVSLFTVHGPNKPGVWEGVKLYHVGEKSSMITSDFDAVVSWSEPDILRDLPAKPVKVVCQMLNDFTYCQPGFDDAVDVWTAPCQMLIDHLVNQPNAPSKNKFVVLPLGCDPSWYSDKRVSGRVIWASSADRGLHLLLQEWPKIKAAVPYADLRIFYNFNYSSVEGMEPNSSNHPHFLELGHRARYMKETIKRLKPLGVEHIGSVSRDKIQEEMSMASILAFPCSTVAFSEGFSVTALEAHASYTVPVIGDTDCLGSVYGNSGALMIPRPVKHHLSEFTDSVIHALTNKSFADEVIAKCQVFAAEHTWAKQTEKLKDIIKSRLRKID